MKHILCNLSSIIIVIIALITNSCGTYLPNPFPFYPKTTFINDANKIPPLSKKTPFIKLHMQNRLVYVLEEWNYNDDNTLILGRGSLYGLNRSLISKGKFKIPIDEVNIAESNTLVPTFNPLATITVLSLGLSALCLGDSKACFGSCPTFYISDGDSMSLMAEGFSTSTNPVWESRDVDALFLADPPGPEIKLRVTNEAHETHVIKKINILAFPKKEGKRIIRTIDNRFFESNLIIPSSCFSNEGDILSKVAFFDNDERYSKASEKDLAEKEYIELSFENIKSSNLALVIGKRQTLLSTFIYYNILDYMGDRRGEDMARLIRKNKSEAKSRERILNALGGIEVQIFKENYGWVPIGSDFEAGPIAKDVVGIPVNNINNNDYIRIRLALTKGLWRIDYIALAELKNELEPIVIEPTQLLDINGLSDPNSLSRLLDPEEYHVTYRGDQFDLFFKKPENSLSYELFLDSEGYYLEWHRDLWLKENNEMALLELQLFPKRALKKLAPVFKEIEEEYEQHFWNSRYEMDNN